MSASNGGVVTPYEGTAGRPWEEGGEIEAPLCLHRTPVLPAWLDYNGHMSESCYLLVVGDNSDAFFRYIGIDEAYRAGGHSLYTVETHLHNLREASEGDPLRLTLQVLDVDAKRLHLFHTTYDDATSEVISTAEQMLVHVDMAAGRATSMPDRLLARVEAVRAAHAELPVPDSVGHVMRIPRRAP